MPEDKFVEVNGLRLHYRDFGDAGKPVALFIHGLTGNAYAFDHVAPKFVGTHHVLTLDFRDHGDSDWESGGDYAFPRHVSDVCAALAALQVPRATLIGSSMGGVVAMVIAATKPDLVDRVVLNDVGPEINFGEPQEAEQGPALLEREFHSIGEALECYRRSYPPVATLPDIVATELVRNSTRLKENGLLRWKTDPRVQATAPSNRSAPTVDLWPLFAAVKVPILVIRGAMSDALLPSTLSKMRLRYPAIKAVEVAGVGHTPWLSEPEATVALREFLPG
jgi:esterase